MLYIHQLIPAIDTSWGLYTSLPRHDKGMLPLPQSFYPRNTKLSPNVNELISMAPLWASLPTCKMRHGEPERPTHIHPVQTGIELEMPPTLSLVVRNSLTWSNTTTHKNIALHLFCLFGFCLFFYGNATNVSEDHFSSARSGLLQL